MDKWSLNELVVAMVYLCHFHALASFVLGCGLTNEPPIPGESPYNNEEVDYSNFKLPVTGNRSEALINLSILTHWVIFGDEGSF